MDLIVRAVDVGSGNTKFVTAANGADIRCVSFPSVAYPSSDGLPSWPSGDRRKTTFVSVRRPHLDGAGVAAQHACAP